MKCVDCVLPARVTSTVGFMHIGVAASSLTGHRTSREPCICTVTAQDPTDCEVSQRPAGAVAQPDNNELERRTIEANAREGRFIAVLTCVEVVRILVRVAALDQHEFHTSWTSGFHAQLI